MNNAPQSKLPWFNTRNQSRLYKLFLVISILAFIFSILYLILNYRYTKGIKIISMPLAPLIFAYLIYMYASKLKQLRK